jgi:hypothetical protein
MAECNGMMTESNEIVAAGWRKVKEGEKPMKKLDNIQYS